MTTGPAPRDRSSTPVAEPRGAVVLEARELVKHFPLRSRSRARVHAVDGVNLTLRAGHAVALVGESGSGKSTVARLLSRLFPQTSGEVLLHGEPVTARAGRAFRSYCRRVQLIFQDPFASLNPAHTVRYTLSRAIRIHHRDTRGPELETALRALLERVQLQPDRYIDKYPHELSGGQRQRVAIARALAANPEALLADEPISMLDVSIRIGILNLLQNLRDEHNIAILYITHDIASARYFADETHVMYAGRIVESGDSESVTQEPRHPYTQLLVRSAPNPEAFADSERSRAVVGERGEPPSMVNPPGGCRFHPRCPFVSDVCRERVPALHDLGAGRAVACWGYATATDAIAAGLDPAVLPSIDGQRSEVTA